MALDNQEGEKYFFSLFFCKKLHISYVTKTRKREILQKFNTRGVIVMSKYVLTDGTRWIQQNITGKYLPMGCEALADIYSRKEADDILAYQLPKALKKVFYAKKIDTEEGSESEKGNTPADIKPLTEDEFEKNMQKIQGTENIQKWLDRVANVNDLALDALNRKEELKIELSTVDKELSDIYHYIELRNLNAAQGYKIYKMIRDRRIKRRAIKNELAVLSIILGKKISDTTMDEIRKNIEGMDNRKYEPRVLSQLFDL